MPAPTSIVVPPYDGHGSPRVILGAEEEHSPGEYPGPSVIAPPYMPEPAPLPPPAPELIVRTDDFNRANGALGSNWLDDLTATESGAGALTISGNKVINAHSGAHNFAYWAETMDQDHYSEIKIATLASWVGVAVRCRSDVDRFYLAFAIGANDYRIFLRKDGNYSSLIQDSVATIAAGDRLRLEAIGSDPVVLNLYNNDVLLLTYSDSTEKLLGGAPGIALWSDAAALDDWEGGEL